MGKIMRRIVRLAILLLMYSPARLIRDDGIPIFACQSVDCDATWAYSLSIDKLRRQIAYLKKGAFPAQGPSPLP